MRHRTAKQQAAPRAEFSTINAGSIVILRAHNKAAEAWCGDHLDPEVMRWGNDGYVIEPRYLGPILDGIRDAGFHIA
jgi:hypothetical protein